MQLRSGQLETGSGGVQVAATLDLQSLHSRCEAGEEFQVFALLGTHGASASGTHPRSPLMTFSTALQSIS